MLAFCVFDAHFSYLDYVFLDSCCCHCFSLLLCPTSPKSLVHVDRGHYWTEQAAQLAGKSHRELFTSNLNKSYNRVYRNLLSQGSRKTQVTECECGASSASVLYQVDQFMCVAVVLYGIAFALVFVNLDEFFSFSRRARGSFRGLIR